MNGAQVLPTSPRGCLQTSEQLPLLRNDMMIGNGYCFTKDVDGHDGDLAVNAFLNESSLYLHEMHNGMKLDAGFISPTCIGR